MIFSGSHLGFFPNELTELLDRSKGKTIKELKASYDNQYDDIIDSNLNLLEKEEFIFFTENPDWFPPMSTDWHEPSVITNGIVEIDPVNLFDFYDLWTQFSDLGCEHIQIIIYENWDLSELANCIELIGNKRIISIEIILPFEENLTEEVYQNFVSNFPRISKLILFSAPYDKFVPGPSKKMGALYFSEEKIQNQYSCGKISKDFFVVNTKSYTESLNHNSCLNRKVSIDKEGNIKNCPSMQESFGNIQNTTLAEAIESHEFKKYWDINKDQIYVCKDCEFRYVCTDCRAYIEDPKDILSKPLKCGYNPYSGEWSKWSNNPLKQKAIDFYGMQELVDELNN